MGAGRDLVDAAPREETAAGDRDQVGAGAGESQGPSEEGEQEDGAEIRHSCVIGTTLSKWVQRSTSYLYNLLPSFLLSFGVCSVIPYNINT